ncbi:DUF302 domain-containing protein [Mucilaginibacter sp. McL0603]|uniref:DUF302 domain-containing protein n=1 Tax=Mucilaginibacter sp. McL0603 TaxID=3415670 RepID=UPI003CFA8AEB
MNPEGVITRESKYSVKETIDRLQAFLQQHGVTIYARIDQQAEVQKAGLNLSPLEYLLFGNPKAGGVLIAENPLIALDLPLKVIVWEDAEKKVWISYNEGAYIEKRYALSHTENSPVNLDPLIAKALDL